MREGFAFPVAHDMWTPLPTQHLNQAPRSGPLVTIFGTLAPGVSMEQAQAELATVGRRAATELRATHDNLQPRVDSYAKLFFSAPSGDEISVLMSAYVFALMLLVLVCGKAVCLLACVVPTRRALSVEPTLALRAD